MIEIQGIAFFWGGGNKLIEIDFKNLGKLI